MSQVRKKMNEVDQRVEKAAQEFEDLRAAYLSLFFPNEFSNVASAYDKMVKSFKSDLNLEVVGNLSRLEDKLSKLKALHQSLRFQSSTYRNLQRLREEAGKLGREEAFEDIDEEVKDLFLEIETESSAELHEDKILILTKELKSLIQDYKKNHV
ncbi:hypothetical protein GW915_11505 [bacterium]|nr:hypothetical protein [bacterium]